MLIPERNLASAAYRYGFNGKENDHDMSSDGMPQDYGERIYDPRVGRWLSVDGYADKYPNHSPYSFSINSPIQFRDANGNWLVDANGNIIFTDGGWAYESSKDGSETIRYQLLYFYTNDGQRVEARRYDSKTPTSNMVYFPGTSEYSHLKDPHDIVEISSTSPETFDCHGYTLNGNPQSLGSGKSRYTMSMYIPANLYIAGSDRDDNDNVSKIYKNKAEFTPVNKRDVQPGDVAIFEDDKGISHSATVVQVGKRGKKVKLDSKDDTNPVQRDLTIKQIMKGNKRDFKRFTGYLRHNENKKVNIVVSPNEDQGNAGKPEGELIKKIIEEAKKTN